MTHYDEDRNRWQDNQGNYHITREDAVKANSGGSTKSGGSFEDTASGGAGMLLVIVAAIGLIVFFFIVSFKFIIAFVGIWWVYRIVAKQLKKRGAEKKTLRIVKISAWAATAVVFVWAARTAQMAQPENQFWPTIAATARISDDVADDNSKASTLNGRKLEPNEPVVLLGSTGDGRYKILKDGATAFVPCNFIDEGAGLMFISPPSALSRALNWKFSDKYARPKPLSRSEYYADGDKTASIELGAISFDNKELTEGSASVTYENRETKEKIYASAAILKSEKVISKNGRLYNYTMTIGKAYKIVKTGDDKYETVHLDEVPGLTGTYVITSCGSFSGDDGKRWSASSYR